MIDVDGVISLWGSSPSAPHCGALALVDGVPHALSRAAAERLAGLADAFELVWCSGWKDRANDYLPHLVGLGPLPYLRFGPPGDREHWKLSAIDAYAGGPPAGLDRRRSAPGLPRLGLRSAGADPPRDHRPRRRRVGGAGRTAAYLGSLSELTLVPDAPGANCPSSAGREHANAGRLASGGRLQAALSCFLVAGLSALGFASFAVEPWEESEEDEPLDSEEEPELLESDEEELSAARLSRFSCCFSL